MAKLECVRTWALNHNVHDRGARGRSPPLDWLERGMRGAIAENKAKVKAPRRGYCSRAIRTPSVTRSTRALSQRFGG
jgi:hypothetical protein